MAVDPAVTMLEQRPPEAAPQRFGGSQRSFPSRVSFAAGMAILTVHHWRDPAMGLAELRRVVRGPVAVMSWDAEVFNNFWMVSEYVPATRTLDRDGPPRRLSQDRPGAGKVETVAVPADCRDGFYAAWWRRPKRTWMPRSGRPSRAWPDLIRYWSSRASGASPTT